MLGAWERLDKINARVLVAGDFNRTDERFPSDWKRWLAFLQVFDVHPSLDAYRHPGGTSALDRCLVPEDWVSSARWIPIGQDNRTTRCSRRFGGTITGNRPDHLPFWETIAQDCAIWIPGMCWVKTSFWLPDHLVSCRQRGPFVSRFCIFAFWQPPWVSWKYCSYPNSKRRRLAVW